MESISGTEKTPWPNRQAEAGGENECEYEQERGYGGFQLLGLTTQ